jgi:hypothetical protein
MRYPTREGINISLDFKKHNPDKDLQAMELCKEEKG